jgi:hypothetical protein
MCYQLAEGRILQHSNHKHDGLLKIWELLTESGRVDAVTRLTLNLTEPFLHIFILYGVVC